MPTRLLTRSPVTALRPGYVKRRGITATRRTHFVSDKALPHARATPDLITVRQLSGTNNNKA